MRPTHHIASLTCVYNVQTRVKETTHHIASTCVFVGLHREGFRQRGELHSLERQQQCGYGGWARSQREEAIVWGSSLSSGFQLGIAPLELRLQLRGGNTSDRLAGAVMHLNSTNTQQHAYVNRHIIECTKGEGRAYVHVMVNRQCFRNHSFSCRLESLAGNRVEGAERETGWTGGGRGRTETRAFILRFFQRAGALRKKKKKAL